LGGCNSLIVGNGNGLAKEVDIDSGAVTFLVAEGKVGAVLNVSGTIFTSTASGDTLVLLYRNNSRYNILHLKQELLGQIYPI
jgi:hypothetical protein